MGYIKRGNSAEPARAYASCVLTGFQPTWRQFLRKKAYTAYADCARTLFQPTRLRALPKKNSAQTQMDMLPFLDRRPGPQGQDLSERHVHSRPATATVLRVVSSFYLLHSFTSASIASAHTRGGAFQTTRSRHEAEQRQGPLAGIDS